jgi:hypothetical protein
MTILIKAFINPREKSENIFPNEFIKKAKEIVRITGIDNTPFKYVNIFMV